MNCLILNFQVNLEKDNPHSQKRVYGGKLPHIWSQSLYIVGCLLFEVNQFMMSRLSA